MNQLYLPKITGGDSVSQSNLLYGPVISKKRAVAIIAIWLGALLWFDQSRLGESLRTKTTIPLSYQIRELFKNSPELDERIKIFGVDDKTVSWLDKTYLGWDDWLSLLRNVERSKPKAVLIDAMFSVANLNSEGNAHLFKTIKSLENLKMNLIVGSFVTPKKIRFRSPLPLDHPIYQIESWTENESSNKKKQKSLKLPEAISHYVYGPDRRLWNVFKKVGHILYRGDYLISPLVQIDDRRVLPHMMLLAESNREIVDGRVAVKKSIIPTYRDGTVPVNFSSYRYYLKKTKSLRPLLAASKKNQPIGGLDPGDIIYIMPAFYTGNTDFKDSPFGQIPAGYVHVAFLNSLLTGRWLKPVLIPEIYLLLAVLIAGSIAALASPLWTLLAGVGGIILWIGSSLYLFAFNDLIFPWLVPVVGYTGVMVCIYIEKMRVAEKKSQLVHMRLEGSLAPDQVEALSKRPEILLFHARERVVTIMFIDVVGFSLLAENQLPRKAFYHLKDSLTHITKLVHEYGGIVNRNLGDGLLCFFGYSLETDETSLDHAEKAVQCGIVIQRENLPRTIEAHTNNDPVYPLRIGINTSSVFLGNIGTGDLIDLTVIGNGVNFAKRLESSCENHSLMIGSSTKDLISSLNLENKGLRRRLIEIKHHKEVVAVWDYDPFYDSIELRNKALEVHRECTQQARIDKRWDSEFPESMKVKTSNGEANLVNFSLNGVRLNLNSFLVKGSEITIYFNSMGKQIREKLLAIGIESIEGEVRWGSPQGNWGLHGIKYRGLTQQQKISLQDILKEVEEDRTIDQPSKAS